MSSGSAETIFHYEAEPDSLFEPGNVSVDDSDNVFTLQRAAGSTGAANTSHESVEKSAFRETEQYGQDDEEIDEILNPPVYEVDAPQKYKKPLRMPLSAGEERQLSYRIKAGDRDARNQLIEAHMHLVVPVAKRFAGRGLDLVDLMQEGNVGLIKAAERWTPRPDTRFASFAIVWIRGKMLQAIKSKAGSIRVPSEIMLRKGKLYDAAAQWENEHGVPPNNEELSGVTDFSIPEIEEALAASRAGVSLNQPVQTRQESGHSFGELGDFLPDPEACDAIDKIPSRLDREAIVKKMTKRQQKALFLRHELGGRLMDVGRELYVEGKHESQTRRAFEMIAFHALESAYSKLRDGTGA